MKNDFLNNTTPVLREEKRIKMPLFIKLLVIFGGIFGCCFLIQEAVLLMGAGRFDVFSGYFLYKEITLIVLYTMPKVLLILFSILFFEHKPVAFNVLLACLVVGLLHTIVYYSHSINFEFVREQLILVVHHVIPYSFYCVIFAWLRRNPSYLRK